MEIKDLSNNLKQAFTYSGKLASAANPPSVADIAVSTSRLPRFSGNCILDWYVLDHQINVANMAKLLGSHSIIGHCLVHDGCEVLTGDIPTPFKTEEIRNLENEAIRNIYLNNNLPILPGIFDKVSYFDKLSLLLEIRHVVLPSTANYIASTLHIDESEYYLDVCQEEFLRILNSRNKTPEKFKVGGPVLLAYEQAMADISSGSNPSNAMNRLMEVF